MDLDLDEVRESVDVPLIDVACIVLQDSSRARQREGLAMFWCETCANLLFCNCWPALSICYPVKFRNAQSGFICMRFGEITITNH